MACSMGCCWRGAVCKVSTIFYVKMKEHPANCLSCSATKPESKKRGDIVSPLLAFWFGSGGWIRTIDLRVMSPTSYHCSTPRPLCTSCFYSTTLSPSLQPLLIANRGGVGAWTYPPNREPVSTIGAATFHGLVRNGSAWVRRAQHTPTPPQECCVLVAPCSPSPRLPVLKGEPFHSSPSLNMHGSLRRRFLVRYLACLLVGAFCCQPRYLARACKEALDSAQLSPLPLAGPPA